MGPLDLTAAEAGQPGCPIRRKWERRMLTRDKNSHGPSCCGLFCHKCLVCMISAVATNPYCGAPCEKCPEAREVRALAQLVVLSFNPR